MAGPDFYTILGVSRTASQDEIKSAHRELVKKYHPDLFPGATQKARANKKLQQINEAYAVLSNAERRQQYDSRYPPRVTIVNPARSAGERRSTQVSPSTHRLRSGEFSSAGKRKIQPNCQDSFESGKEGLEYLWRSFPRDPHCQTSRSE
jgi:DnaJ-class molecular chaperone